MNFVKWTTKSLVVIFIILALSFSTVTLAENLHSKYKGQESRAIKSLSDDDISELTKGGGWGLAKAAELNGFPGPVHILQMEQQIALSVQQKAEIQTLFNKMNAEAIVLGKSLIALETELNKGFSEGTINQEKLGLLVDDIAKVRAELRLSHLSTHLKTPEILTKHQLVLYNKLRGYGNKNPCENIPTGHDPEMWKKHNDCS